MIDQLGHPGLPESFPAAVRELSMETVMPLKLRQMLPKLLWVGALRVIAKALQMEREAARVSSKTRAVGKPTELVLAGSNPLYGALPWEAPSNTSTALLSQ